MPRAPAIALVSLLGVLAVLLDAGVPAVSPSSAHVPPGLARNLKGMGITYVDLSAVDDASRTAALDSVSRGFSAVVRRAHSGAVVVAATFTDTSYKRRARDHDASSRIIYRDRRALMVICPHTPIALTGPPGSPSGAVMSTLVAFVDPGSFRVLRAVSFETDARVLSPAVGSQQPWRMR